jgi:hypothetical protein
MSEEVHLPLVLLLFFAVDEDFEEVAQDLDTLLDLPLDQVEDTLGEVLVKLQSFRVKVAVHCPLKVEVGFIEVLVM